MANADKCHLNIPFKDTVRQLRAPDGTLEESALADVSGQMFENFKSIERRINDPACEGAGCTAVTLIAESNTFALGGTNELALVAGTSIASAFTDYDTLDSSGGSWTVSESIHPPVDGIYWVALALFLGHVSGTGNVACSPYITPQNPLGSSFDYFGGTYSPSGYSGNASVSGMVVCTAGNGFIPSLLLSAAAASTRTMGLGMAKVSASLICGT